MHQDLATVINSKIKVFIDLNLLNESNVDRLSNYTNKRLVNNLLPV